jgi:diacylglycerol O-acyltransferase
MRQLTSIDAQFLALEDGRTTGHVSSVAILDPTTTPSGTLTLADITRVFQERLHLLPPLRCRLLHVPLQLDHPYWQDDPHFDLEFHLRELHLPPPGNLAQLAEQVSRIASRPLDRGRPLWECYLIGGLQDGNVALMTKIHHALVDGVSGAEILGILFDTEPTGRDVPPVPEHATARRPADGELLARGLIGLPRNQVRGLVNLPKIIQHLDTVPTLRNIPGGAIASSLANRAHRAATRNRDGRLLERGTGRAPRTTFNRSISPHRRVALGSLCLDEIKAIKNAFGATVNDVVVALCTSAIRDWLQAHDELPEDPLLSMVPVSVRTKADTGTFGNRVSVMIVPLATNEPDPVRRLQRTHETLRSAKERHRAVPADLLVNANHLVPARLLARASRVAAGLAASGRVAPPYNVILSNVPGPAIPLYIAGARQIANYPVSLIHDGVGLNVTVFSYQDRVDFGLVADRDQMPDLSLLIKSLREALEQLKDAQPDGRKRTRDRRSLRHADVEIGKYAPRPPSHALRRR